MTMEAHSSNDETQHAVIAAVLLLVLGRAAWTHRIDEYLQASMVSLEAD